MEAIIKDLVETTRVRDRKGEVIVSFKGKVFTLILRILIVGLMLVFIAGFTTLVFNLIVNVLQDNVQFGMYN